MDPSVQARFIRELFDEFAERAQFGTDSGASEAFRAARSGAGFDPGALLERFGGEAGAAVRRGALVGAAAADLRCGAEPSGFNAALARMAGPLGERGSGGDVG